MGGEETGVIASLARTRGKELELERYRLIEVLLFGELLNDRFLDLSNKIQKYARNI